VVGLDKTKIHPSPSLRVDPHQPQNTPVVLGRRPTLGRLKNNIPYERTLVNPKMRLFSLLFLLLLLSQSCLVSLFSALTLAPKFLIPNPDCAFPPLTGYRLHYSNRATDVKPTPTAALGGLAKDGGSGT